MTDPICQLMEDVEGLCKRCYHLQKSNNDMYGKRFLTFRKISLNSLRNLDYLQEDQQMQEYIDENEKIIAKYHRKLNEIFQLIRENSETEIEIQCSPIAMDYKRLETEEKKSCDEKKKK